MPVWRRAAALFVVLVAAPRAARADIADYIGKPIATVRLTVAGSDTTDPALVQLVETRAGRPLAMGDVRESIMHLFSLGRFEDVVVDATMAGAGVALRYELSPLHPIATIDFTGDLRSPGIDEGHLRRVVVDRFGVSPAGGRGADVARLVADTLAGTGYRHATVTAREDLERPDRARLVLNVEPGVRTHIGTIDIEGVPPRDRGQMLSDLRVSSGVPYEPEVLIERIDRYVEGRHRRGYYEAKVTPAVRLVEDDRLANLTLRVAPGPHVRVVFVGDSLPSDQRAALVPIEREGSADEDLLEDSSNRIEEYLRGQGYRQASAPHAREEAGGELLITFTVKKGPQFRVDRVTVVGNAAIPLASFDASLRTRAGQPFSDARLEADLSLIEAVYRRQGFARARATSTVDAVQATGAGAVPVTVSMAVVEGARTVVGSVRVEGGESIEPDALLEDLGLQAGRPYFDAQLAADRDAIQLKYADLGYQNATVDARPNFSEDGTRADPVFIVREGPQILVDHILIVGNVKTSASTVEHELQLERGDPLGLTAVNESQRRLAALGLFRRATITELKHGDENARDLLVTVEEAPATTIGYGLGGQLTPRTVQGAEGGIATHRFDFAPRGSIQISRRNLFGKNRSGTLFASLSLHSAASSSADEYRVVGSFREPRLFNTSADAVVTAVQEQQLRTLFDFSRRSFGAQVTRRLTREVSVTGNYQIQKTTVFNLNKDVDQLLIDRLFAQVRLSSFSASVIGDTRDDPVEPSSGYYLSAFEQVAGRGIGSEVGFAKSFFTAQIFKTLPHTRRIVLAGDARLGVASGFPRDVVNTDFFGLPFIDVVKDLPASERFFAGGDTTVRGFTLDSLGAPGTIKNGFALGGNGLVIFNAELRVPVRWGVGVVGFFDTGNVFARATDIDLGALRSSAGVGIRYKSPLGPFRIDLGFKLHREDIAPGRRESASEWHFSFGQAF